MQSAKLTVSNTLAQWSLYQRFVLDWQLQEMPPDNWVVVGKRYQPETEETAGEIARVEHSSLGYRKLDIKWHKTNRIIRVVGVAYNSSGCNKKTHEWIRQRLGVPEEEGLIAHHLRKRKLSSEEEKLRPGHDVGNQVGSITSKNWQSWLKQRHTRECRRFYEDHGNTAAGAMMLLALFSKNSHLKAHFWAIFKTNVILCTLKGHHTFCSSNT